LILRPASDNAQFMRPAIVIRFPTPDVEKSVVVGCPSHLTKHRNIIELCSCIASESRKFFNRVFYSKQINFITGGPLAAGGPGQLPPLPPLNPALDDTHHLNASFKTGPRATNVVLAGDPVLAGTVLVTPGLGYSS